MLCYPSPARRIFVLVVFILAAADIKKVLGAAEASASDDDIKRLLESVKGKKIHELIAAGTKKIGSGPAPSAGSTAGSVTKE